MRCIYRISQWLILFVGITAVIGFASSKGFFTDGFVLGRLKPQWEWLDPGSDSSYSLIENPGYIRIIAPKGENSLDINVNMNAPRLILISEGDFSIETRVKIKPKYSLQGAGLLIWSDAENFIKLERLLKNGSKQEVQFSVSVSNNLITNITDTYTDSNVFFILIRKGDYFSGWYSLDGNQWNKIAGIHIDFPSNVKVGIFVENQWQDYPIYADFDYFRLN